MGLGEKLSKSINNLGRKAEHSVNNKKQTNMKAKINFCSTLHKSGKNKNTKQGLVGEKGVSKSRKNGLVAILKSRPFEVARS